MQKITRKKLGQKYATKYFPGSFSIKRYKLGWEIKPVNQNPIFLTNEDISLLANDINSENMAEEL